MTACHVRTAPAPGEFPQPQRVALVIRRLVQRSGGAERIFCELAGMLADKGYAVTCLHFDPTDGQAFYPIDNRVERINLAPIRTPFSHQLVRFASKLFFLPRSLRRKARWHARNHLFFAQLRDYFSLSRPSVAISFLPSANTPTLLAAVGTDVKTVPTNHNVPEKDYTDPGRFDPNPHDRYLRLQALDQATAIHVLFPVFGRWFDDSLRDRIVAVPNYVSPDILRASPRAERDDLILAVGRLAEVKNYFTLLDAWTLIAGRHPSWKIMIYGVGPQLQPLTAEVRRRGLQDSFLLPGHRSNLGEEYARSAIFCHPAHFEGFGLAAAEALALETPVVGFADCPGIDQFVVDGYNGLMVERDGGAEALAAALDRLIADPDLRRRLGKNGPPSVAAFTEARYADAWVEVIEKVAPR